MKILIVKTSALGDIVHVFPSIAYIKSKFPDAELHWTVEKPHASLVRAHPDISHVHLLETKKWRRSLLSVKTLSEIIQFKRSLQGIGYDYVIDFQGNSKSALVTCFSRAKKKAGFAKGAVAEWPNLFATNMKFSPPRGENIRSDYLFLVQSLFGIPEPFNDPPVLLRISGEEQAALADIIDHSCLQKKRKILVCGGAAWSNKRLGTAQLLEILKQVAIRFDTAFLFGWGSGDERSQADYLHAHFPASSLVVPKLSLPAFQNLMAKVSLVIAMDSLPLHLAGTTKTPSWGIFGPSSGDKYSPDGEGRGFFQGSCPYRVSFETRCPKLRSCKTGACLKSTSSEILVAEVCKFIEHETEKSSSALLELDSTMLPASRSILR